MAARLTDSVRNSSFLYSSGAMSTALEARNMGIMSENEIGVTAMTGIRKFRGFPDQVEPSPSWVTNGVRGWEKWAA